MSYQFRDKELRKKYRSVSIPWLSPVLFNQTDVDRMITQLGERMIKEGLTAPPAKTTVIAPESSGGSEKIVDIQVLNDFRIGALQSHPRLKGFQGEDGKEILTAWLRATVTNEVEAGRGANGPRIVDYLEPLSVAIYRTGLPATRSKQRGADILVYGMMLTALEKYGAENPAGELSALAESLLGLGIDFGIYPKNRPAYDGHTNLDIETMFAVIFAETFVPNDRQVKAPEFDVDYLIPGAIEPIGQDLVVLLKHVKDNYDLGQPWATRDVVNVLTSLVSFRLMQLPLRLGRGLRSFVSGVGMASDLADKGCDATSGRQWFNPCEMYFDFTDVPESSSDELAKKCVARDLSILEAFQRDRMYVKVFEHLLPAGAKAWRDEVQSLVQKHKYREALWLMKDAHGRGDFEVPAAFALEAISNQYLQGAEGDSSEDSDQASMEYLANVKARSASDFDAFVNIVSSVNEVLGLDGLHKWFRTVTGFSVGGERKAYCALRGTPTAKQTWRYSASDELLVAMVYMCFAEFLPHNYQAPPIWVDKLPLSVLLTRLRERFGILIDQIPDGMDSPSSRSAVSKNLEAFKLRLKMLGCFEDLSDDLVAQYVRRPL